jgi:hypothetical protein
MNSVVRIPLVTTPQQFAQLEELQLVFTKVCNAIAPEVQRTRVWNRVVMHHMHYKSLREKFPELGSQMACNAIYAVSRTSRMLFQMPTSPFSLNKLGSQQLPLIRFENNCPVFFDRHTLSFNGTTLSLFTLKGRIKFDIKKNNIKINFEILDNIQEIFLIKSDFLYELNFIYKVNSLKEKNKDENNKFEMPDYLRI